MYFLLIIIVWEISCLIVTLTWQCMCEINLYLPQDRSCVHEYCYLSVHIELPQRCQIPTHFVGLLIFFLGSGESSIVAIIVLLPSILGQFTLNYMHDRSLPPLPPYLDTRLDRSKKWGNSYQITTRKKKFPTNITKLINGTPQLKTSETTHHWLHDLESKFRTCSV